MTNINDVLGAIVDYSFGREFSQTVAKASGGTRSYTSLSKQEQFEFLNEIVENSGLNSLDRSLGGHPDFNHLSDEITMDSSIVTMFADLRNFTRYGLFLDKKLIRTLKQSVISSFIHIVHAYDGHVHNIPGDGLMVYFGGLDKPDDESAFNAYMAGSSLIYALENYINPILQNSYGFEDKLHMRVGVEFGEVVWGQFGLGNVSEVKATGFSVDFASKIQHLAETDEMRVGEKIYQLSPFAQESFSDTKVYTKQMRGQQKNVRHYRFNWREAINSHEKITGQSTIRTLEYVANNRHDVEPSYINPRMFEILATRALPTSKTYKISLVAKISPRLKGPFKENYYGNRKLPKNWWIKFIVEHSVPGPVEIEWEAVNNGKEAFENHLGHINNEGRGRKYAYEHTAYTGNHIMFCRIIKDGQEVARALQPVIVK